jgi:glycosyltransferase involved in cell wall biosynthesis
VLDKISVIIPAYNSASTILETICSVQQQTYSNFEIIVINDGSTDEILEILEAMHEPRLKVFSCENRGVSAARNFGIAQSIGKFLSFIDADDVWSPDKLELQLSVLQRHPDAAVVYSWTRFLNECNQTFQDDMLIDFTGNVLKPLLLRNFIASGSNILVKREAVERIGGFDPEMSPAEDWDFYLRLAAIYSFVMVPKIQIFYRQTKGSASSKVAATRRASLRVIEKTFKVIPSNLQPLKQQSLARTYQYTAELYLRYNGENSNSEAIKELWKSVKLYPAIVLEKEFRSLVKWIVKNWFDVRGKPNFI